MNGIADLPAALPPAPARVVGADGQPVLGRFAGVLQGCDWERLARPHARGGLWRRLHNKRWHYVALATEQIFCAVAIVDLGWMSTCFGYAFDRSDGDMMANFSTDGLPGRLSVAVADGAGGTSRFERGATRIEIGPDALTVRCPWLEIDARFGAAPSPALLATGLVQGGSVHATQKSGGLPLSGEVRTWRDEYRLDGGVASFDLSNGLLARETSWRWASAHALDVGFNLQAGYFGACENALWLNGALYPLGPARFIVDRKDVLAPWHIFTEDDCLDVIFTPAAARREQRDLKIAASRYVQPLGTFSGWVRGTPEQPKRPIERLAGVTEDHFARW
jgi:hypothetical protein